VEKIFERYGSDIAVIIHNAAHPSHDLAIKDPFTDFTVNANDTLVLLEMTRQHCPDAVSLFTSTDKVYGDT
jgi:CDP-paratose 2-epimerase